MIFFLAVMVLFFFIDYIEINSQGYPRLPAFSLSLPLSPLHPILTRSFAPWTNSVVSSRLLYMLNYRGNF